MGDVTSTESGIKTTSACDNGDAVARLREENATLRDFTRRLVTGFNRAEVGLSRTGFDGNFYEVNDYLCRLLGRSREELLGMSVADVTHPDDLLDSVAAIQRVIFTGETVTIDKRYIHADGRIIWANTAINRLNDESGNPRGVFAVTVDLTERRRAALVIRESEDHLRMALDAARMGMWKWDASTDSVTLDKAASMIVGSHRREIDSITPILNWRIHPDDAARYFASLRHARLPSGTGRFDIEFRWHRPDRRWVWLHQTGKAVFQRVRGETCVVELTGTLADITERKNAERKVRIELADMRVLQETSAKLIPEGETDTLISDIVKAAIQFAEAQKGVLQLVDQETGDLVMIGSEDVANKVCGPYAKPGHKAATPCILALRRGSRVFVDDYEVDPRFSGTPSAKAMVEIGVRASLSIPLISRGGRMLAMLNVYWSRPRVEGLSDRQHRMLDVLARQAADHIERSQSAAQLRRTEHELRNLSHSLECRVEERTDELKQQAARLRDLTVEVASAEQRERKRLAAVLHDDLQQLLVAARMRLAIAEKQLQGSEVKAVLHETAGLIGQAVSCARGLTQQLRPPVLYEAGLAPALGWLGAEMSTRHQLDVTVAVDGTGPLLNDDIKALLFECVRELLFNIVKYAEVDAATVEMDWTDEQIRLAVEDRGKGFDVTSITSSSSGGGFGLFSVRERLTALGGVMRIESQPGQGTRVELSIPLQEGFLAGESEKEGAAFRSQPANHSAGRSAVITDSRTRVVVVDDHSMVRQGLASTLGGDQRISVVGEAGDGREAILVVERQSPDVVLMDVNMPGMNGVEATRRLRARWPDLSIIALSVQDDESTAQSMADAGASMFLSKSADSEQMINAILRQACPTST